MNGTQKNLYLEIDFRGTWGASEVKRRGARGHSKAIKMKPPYHSSWLGGLCHINSSTLTYCYRQYVGEALGTQFYVVENN